MWHFLEKIGEQTFRKIVAEFLDGYEEEVAALDRAAAPQQVIRELLCRGTSSADPPPRTRVAGVAKHLCEQAGSKDGWVGWMDVLSGEE